MKCDECGTEGKVELKTTTFAGNFVKGRRLTLHNLQVFTCVNNHSQEIYSSVAKLLDLVESNKDEEHFTFDNGNWRTGE